MINTENGPQDAKNSLWASNLKPKEEIEIWIQLNVDFSWKYAPDGNHEQELRNDLEQEVITFLHSVYLPQIKKRADSRLIEAIKWRKKGVTFNLRHYKH